MTATTKSARDKMKVHYSSETSEWGTPQVLFDALDAEFKFELDVCATPQNAKCKSFFSKVTDGLTQPWSGTCWMNPPYGREIAAWIRKAATCGTKVVALLPARTDTAWFQDFCLGREIRFLRGRLHFNDGPGRCPFPCMIVVFDPAAQSKPKETL